MKKIISLLFCVLLATNLLSAATYTNLYIVGDGCDAGWDPGKAPEMTKTADGIFTYTGNLNANTNNQRFKFIVAHDWHPSITCDFNVKGHVVLTPGVDYDLFERATGETGYDNAFQVTTSGIYTIDVNLNTMKLRIALAGEEPKPELGSLFLIGSATKEADGWNNSAPISMTKLSEGVFIWTGDLFTNGTDPGQFRFMTQAGTWDKSINARGVDVNVELAKSYDLKYRPLQTSPEDFKFQVATAGKYTIEVDLNKMKMKFMHIDYENLFIIGNALTGKAGFWDTVEGIAMTKSESGVFSWTGKMYSQDTESQKTGFKFLNQQEKDNWKNTFVYDEKQTANKEIVDGGEYTISYCIAGRDNKFEIPEAASYTVSVNLNTMKMSIVKASETGIEKLSDNLIPFKITTDNGIVSITMQNGIMANCIDIFDITGNLLVSAKNITTNFSCDNTLGEGVYIVKINANDQIYSSKILIK